MRNIPTIKRLSYEPLLPFVSSMYKLVNHLWEKEASASSVILPFLGLVVEELGEDTHYLVDPEFRVSYKSYKRGRKPATDFAVCVSVGFVKGEGY